jgi:hypothetical protein
MKRVAGVSQAVMLLVILGLLVPASWGQGTAADTARDTQTRLLAKRAAQADALRNLAEQVKGLRLTSSTFVRDFVAESDEINARLDTFLKGAKVTDVRYMEDGSAEVTMELPIKTVEAELTSIYKAHYKGDKYKINDFESLHVTNKVEKISATGNGAPRSAEAEVQSAAKPAAGRVMGLPPAWKNVPARARLMAVRAARVDALRNLTEQVKGLRIRGETYVRDFVAESDQIRTSLDAFIQGVKESDTRYKDDLSVEVDVKVPLQTVITELKKEYEAYYKGNKVQVRDFEQMKQTVKVDWVSATGSGVPPEKYLTGGETVVQETAAPSAPDWTRNTATAKGNGIKPADAISEAQAKLLALRAAKVEAMRNLSEEVDGLVIDSHTKVKDFIATNDQVRTEVNNYLKGVRTVTEDYNAETGEGTVTIEAPLQPVWDIVIKYRKEVHIVR